MTCEETPSSEPTRRRAPGLVLKTLLSIGIAGSCLWVLRRGALPVFPPEEALTHVKWWAPPTYFALWSALHVVRALRWRWLLAPLGPLSLRLIVPVAWIGIAAVTIMPFRSGEAVRPLLLAQRSNASGWAVTGTIAAERTIDGLIVSTLLLVGLALAELLDPLPERVGELELPVSALPATAISVLLLFMAAFAVLLAFRRAVPLGLAILARSVEQWSPRASRWLGACLERIAGGLAFLPSARHSLPYLAESTLFWLVNVTATWLLALGCGFDAGLAQGAVIVGVLVLGVMVPNAPGFFGAFQLSVYTALLLFFSKDAVESRGAAFVFLLYSVQIGVTLAAGAIGALWLWRPRHHRARVHATRAV